MSQTNNKQKQPIPSIFAERHEELNELATLARTPEDWGVIDELRQEILLGEEMQAAAYAETDAAIERSDALDALNKNMGDLATVETLKSKLYPLSRKQVKWLSEPVAEVPVERHESPQGFVFWYGDLTPFSNATRIKPRQFNEATMEDIDETLLRHIGQKLENPAHRARDLRPLEVGTTKERTTLNSYKDDNVNPEAFDSNQVRALLLEDGTQPEPVFLLASVCMHKQQQKKIYNL